MTFIMRNIINKCFDGIYRRRNIKTHLTNMAYGVNILIRCGNVKA